MDATDISLPAAEDPFYKSFWLAVALPEAHAPNLQQTLPTSSFYLTKSREKLKAHMHERHKLAENSKKQYKSWQLALERLKGIMSPSSPGHYETVVNAGLRTLVAESSI